MRMILLEVNIQLFYKAEHKKLTLASVDSKKETIQKGVVLCKSMYYNIYTRGL